MYFHRFFIFKKMHIDDVDWSDAYDGETFEIMALGEPIVGCHWRCKNGPPKYVIVYAHGLCSALCFNANVLRVFTEHGGAAIACDHQGHGRSMHKNNTQTTVPQIVDEIKQLIRYARVLYSDTPIYLMGHSLGGLSTLAFCLEKSTYVEMIKGVIVTGPWIRTKAFPNPAPWLRAAIAIGAKFFQGVGIPTGLNVAKSTYPEGYKKVVANSQYMQTKASPVLLNSALKAMDVVQVSASSFPAELPLLFMQGTADSMVHVQTNQKWAAEVKHAKYVEFEDAPHDIMKSKYRKEAFEHIFRFIGIE